ncbi:5-oxoprolinase subunit B family protein [Thalassovita sp.]|uniref:5-oxoprolinase subunit B family protein n=1 Tax=Thalassovita sp. TaxID=1979401 RepID=UPI003B5A2F55
MSASNQNWPSLRSVGLDGVLVSFGGSLSEPANRAALAFRAAVDRAGFAGVVETAPSLVSCYVRYEPLEVDPQELRTQLQGLMDGRDWYAAPLPQGRRLWRIPTVYGGALAPQLAEAAGLAGMSEIDAITALSSARVRVQTIGFAPGMPYLGALPQAWDIPRQTDLTPNVPAGGLCVAIRQLVLFPVATQTGWRQVGQTAIRLFDPTSDTPFVLRPGDEVQFPAIDLDTLDTLRDDPLGGAISEELP